MNTEPTARAVHLICAQLNAAGPAAVLTDVGPVPFGAHVEILPEEPK